MEFIYKLLVFTITLSVIVFVHEYGHFWVARKNGVKVDSFSIGFGPEILGWTDKLGTRWRFSIIPLGGYVKMYGDADASSRPSHDIKETDKHLTLEGKKPHQRIAVAAAGPFANFIFTIVAFAFLFSFKGISVVTPIIEFVQENSVAERSGLKVNDKIISIDDQAIDDFMNFRRYLKKHAGETVTLTIERDNEQITIKTDLFSMDGETKKPVSVLGIQPMTHYDKVPIYNAIGASISMTWDLIKTSFSFLFSLITLQEKSGEIGGIITIGDQITKAAESGIWKLVEFMAFLSLQLGVINLLPVPVLDGGHILMNSIEMIIRKPINEKVQNILYKVGLFFVLGLMGYGMLSDLKRYAVIGKIMEFFSR